MLRSGDASPTPHPRVVIWKGCIALVGGFLDDWLAKARGETTTTSTTSMSTNGGSGEGGVVVPASFIAAAKQRDEAAGGGFFESSGSSSKKAASRAHLTVFAKFEVEALLAAELGGGSRAAALQALAQRVGAMVSFDITNLGLGRVSEKGGGGGGGGACCYFLVLSWPSGAAARRRLVEEAAASASKFAAVNYISPSKDFHLTVGFSPRDVHGVHKGAATIVAAGAMPPAALLCAARGHLQRAAATQSGTAGGA